MKVLLVATVQSHICQFHKPLVAMLHEHDCEAHVAARNNLAEKNGLVITGEHRYSCDITIPYNNRRLLTLMLAIPVEMRINDELYWKVRSYANPDVDDAGIQINNLKHTSNRAKMERLYLEIHSRFPW